MPAVFILMDDIGRLLWRVFSRFVGPVDEPGAEGEVPQIEAQSAKAEEQKEAPIAEPEPIPTPRAAE